MEVRKDQPSHLCFSPVQEYVHDDFAGFFFFPVEIFVIQPIVNYGLSLFYFTVEKRQSLSFDKKPKSFA